MIKPRLNWIVPAALGVVIVAAVGVAVLNRVRTTDVRIAVSEAGSIGYRAAEKLDQILQREQSGVRLQLVPTTGATTNMDLLDRGEVSLAVVQADLPPAADARLLAHLVPQLYHLIVPVNSLVGTPADLVGLRVGTLPEGSGAFRALQVILDHYAIEQQHLAVLRSEPFDVLIAAFEAGELDAVFLSDIVGAERPTRLLAPGAARLVPIDQVAAMRLKRPALTEAIISRGTYDASPALPPEDLPTVAVQTQLVADADLPAPVVYAIASALFDHRHEFATVNPQATGLSAPEAGAPTGIALHAGAERYLARDEPSMIEANPDFFALILTLITLGGSSAFAIRTMLTRSQKNRADQHNREIMALLERSRNLRDLAALAAAEAQLYEILNQVIDDIDHDRIDPESVESFKLAWNPAIESIRHRQMLARQTQEPVA